MSKAVCGWREWVALPALGIERVKAKVDTGARTSALHALSITDFERDGAQWARFRVHPNQRSKRGEVWCEARVIDRRDVRNSGGKAQRRYVVETLLQIGGASWPIELTLTSREDMGFRMLLGRTAVRDRFVVDARRSYLAGGKPSKHSPNIATEDE